MQAVSASGRFHAGPALIPAPEPADQPPPIARAGDVQCSCCRRNPLVGEKAILHVSGGTESWVCELCERSTRNVAPLGEVRDRVQVRPALVGAERYIRAA